MILCFISVMIRDNFFVTLVIRDTKELIEPHKNVENENRPIQGIL